RRSYDQFDNPLADEPLGLGDAVLQSVSPCHCKFITNMGIRASMSLSLVKGERLWGLVACHHRSPRFVPYRTRLICGFLGDFASWSLCSRLELEGAEVRLRASAVRMHLVEQMSAHPDLLEALVDGQTSALDQLDAGGFAAAHQGRVVTCGA